MSVKRVGVACATLAFTGLAAFGLQAPALATHNCPNPAGHYPPGQNCPPAVSVGDTTPVPGDKHKVRGEGFKPGSKVDVFAQSTPIFLASFTANSIGVIEGEVTIPLGLSVGAHSIVLNGVNPNGVPISVRTAFTVTAANKALSQGRGNQGGGALPTTGGEIVAVTATGLALVGVGAAAVYSGRRRRVTAAA